LAGSLALLLGGCSARASDPGATVPRRASEPASERERFLEMFARAYFPGRSGQIFIVPERGEFLLSRPDDVYRFMHGSPWDYDVDIPLVLYGPGFVQKGSFADPASQQDIAPTVAELLRLPVPASMSGHPLRMALAGAAGRPRAVVLAVLDGMRADYFDRLATALPNFNRLRNEGASFRNARVNFLPSVTSTGHATIGTGTDPRFHGINANAVFDSRSGKSDGPFKGMSPSTFMVLSLADHWNLASDGKAVILVQGTTPRATLGLAGYGGCAVSSKPFVLAMFDERSATWVTNEDCYRLPGYLQGVDARAVWESAGDKWMGHDVNNGRTLLRTGLFPRFQMDALVTMIAKESVGADEIADLVLVNLKTPDYVSHQYGPESKETESALASLDEQIGRLVATLDERVGRDRYVLVLTADHGMPPEPESSGHARHYVEDITDEIHDRFDPGGRRLVLDFSDPANLQLAIDPVRLDELGLKASDVAAFLQDLPFIRMAFTEDEVRAVRLPR
jgi:predicted AlkP superfamily pyrophosphatase or phosphodiesterase